MANVGEAGHAGGSRGLRRKRWLGRLLLFLGLVLLAIGLMNASWLLASPLEGQGGYLARTVFPLVVGLWLVVSGIYTLGH